MKSTALLYEDRPRYDPWMRPLVSGFIALFLLLGAISLYFNDELAITMFALAVFIGLLFAAIIPRRLQIYEDRLRIKLGGPLACNIPLEHIREARRGSGGNIFVYWGIKFATSTSNVLEIVRSKGMNVIITPAHFKEFVKQLDQAVQARAADDARQ